MIYAVYAVDWIEFERGWGQRHDGTSYHNSLESAKQHVINYDKEHNNQQSVPDCYTKGGDPYIIEVDKKLYDKVMIEKVVWK